MNFLLHVLLLFLIPTTVLLASVYHTILAVMCGIYMIPSTAYWTLVLLLSLPSKTAQAATDLMSMILDLAESSLQVRVGLILLALVIGALSMIKAANPIIKNLTIGGFTIENDRVVDVREAHARDLHGASLVRKKQLISLALRGIRVIALLVSCGCWFLAVRVAMTALEEDMDPAWESIDSATENMELARDGVRRVFRSHGWIPGEQWDGFRQATVTP